MTGTITYADLRGGLIRSDGFSYRVPFVKRELVGLTIQEASGALVSFDTIRGPEGPLAVRVRRAREAPV
jgi:hypothetical protein